MAIVLIGGEKGGTGKTTIATNMAAMRAIAGRDVLLIDTDQQASASFWNQIRDEEEIKPRVACMNKFGKGLQAEVKDLKKRYQDIIIDAGGRESIELRSALVVCDRAFVPIIPSQFDVWTLTRMDQLVSTAQAFNPDLKATIVISKASPNPVVTESTEVIEMVKEFENMDVADTIIRDRIVYRKAGRAGQVAVEMKPGDTKANEEMQSIYSEVFRDAR